MKAIADEAGRGAVARAMLVCGGSGTTCRCRRGATSAGTRPSPSRPASCRRSRSTPEHPYLLTYTSGTTGKPKGVVHVHGGFLVSIAREVAYQADVAPGRPAPLRHRHGLDHGPVDGGRRRRRRRTIVLAEGAPDWPGRPALAHGRAGARDDPRLSPTLIRALIPHGEPDGTTCRRCACSSRPASRGTPSPYRGCFEQVGGGALPDHQLLGRHRGRRVLPLAARRPSRSRRARSAGPRSGWRWTSSTRTGRSVARRGRRARLPQAVARDDARLLARPGALPRDVLAPLPGRVGARRLGVGRRGRLLVPARPLRRHAQHRRQADRAGRARVGRGRPPGGRRGGGDRRAARGEGRGRRGSSACLCPGASATDELAGEVADAVADELGKAFRPERVVFVRGAAEDAQREDRAARGAREGARRATPATSRRSRTPRRSRRSSGRLELDATGGARHRAAGAGSARTSRGSSRRRARASPSRRARATQVEAVAREIGGLAVEADVSDRGRRRARWSREVERELGPIDAARRQRRHRNLREPSAWEVDPDDWWHVFEVNVLGVVPLRAGRASPACSSAAAGGS